MLDKVGDFDDSIIENIKFAFIHKGLLLNSVNIEDNESEECEEIDDGGADNNLTSEKNQLKIENTKEKYDDYNYLFNGDVLLEEKLKRKKNNQKVTTEVKNMLDELEI